MHLRRAVVLANVWAAALAMPQQQKPPRPPTVADFAAHAPSAASSSSSAAAAAATAAATAIPVSARSHHHAAAPNLPHFPQLPAPRRHAAALASFAHSVRPLATVNLRPIQDALVLLWQLAAAFGTGWAQGAAVLEIGMLLSWPAGAALAAAVVVGITAMVLTVYFLDGQFSRDAARLTRHLQRFAAARSLAFRAVDLSGAQNKRQRDELLSTLRPLPQAVTLG